MQFLNKKYNYFFKRIFRQNQGVFLVELMIALSVTVVSILAMLGLLSRSLSLNRAISNDYIATYLAAEGIEIVKNIIDTNKLENAVWIEDLNEGSYEPDYTDDSLSSSNVFSGKKLRFDDSSGIYQYTAGVETPFIRKVAVKFIQDAGGEVYVVRVDSTVEWSGIKGIKREIHLRDYFYHWWRF